MIFLGIILIAILLFVLVAVCIFVYFLTTGMNKARKNFQRLSSKKFPAKTLEMYWLQAEYEARDMDRSKLLGTYLPDWEELP